MAFRFVYGFPFSKFLFASCVPLTDDKAHDIIEFTTEVVDILLDCIYLLVLSFHLGLNPIENLLNTASDTG